MRVLVLGAGSFLGRHVVEAARSSGHEVRVLAGEVPADLSEDVERRPGDPELTRTTVAAARGCDAVIAADPLPVAVSKRVIPAVTEALERARRLVSAVEQGAPEARIARVGSALAVGSTVSPERLCRAGEWTLGKGEPRVRAHVESERLAALEAERRGLDLVSVLPTLVLGPGSPDPSADLRLVKSYVRWRVARFAHGGLNVIDVRDAAHAIVRAADRPTAARRYVVGGENLSYKALYRSIAAAIGAHHVHVALPRPVGFAIAGAAELWARLAGTEPAIGLDQVDLTFGRYAYYDTEPARRDLDLTVRPVAETMEASVACLREAGLV